MSAHPTIRPRPGVMEIAPYVGGKSHAAGANRTIKLSSNENPLGPSPAARAAYAASADGLALYPDGSAVALRAAIAETHGLEAGRIVCGAGSDELIALLCKAYSGPGDEVLYSQHGFLMYRLSALAAGATPVVAPEAELTTDVDALIRELTPRTRLVFLANPNNPTGTMVDAGALARLAEALPPAALLVLDAAYAEYVRDQGYDGGVGLVRARDNVVMTRTFSKIHGLAALRLGWAYAPEHVVDVLNRVRGPFNVSAPALAAGEAAIRDREYVDHCAIQNEVWRDWLAKELAAAGLKAVPSSANFLLVEIGPSAPAADEYLQLRGIVVRRMEGYGLPHHLRISVGDEAACRAVAGAMRAFVAESAR
ncbi:histidinol-phosphate transaminase [Limibaculum sp. M0105]|uniref:Histidinol-phosphate aminotransferase n=1 Tax=Thermohalobaculum xanthum TaxID=2753746 RepID=A0A8J7M6X4_9RHOB|nr:histidinol-phosphate transaminase [Thermohalobaculum xanthum]MBK0399649.1 histidinol-phosphate transaminase [Thermohalobaculum xanthum]